MNEQLIYRLIKPYIKNNRLSYKAFFKLFYFLSRADQYKVINLIEEKFNVHVCDEDEEESSSQVDDEKTTTSNELEDNIVLPDPTAFDDEFEGADEDDEYDSLYDKDAFVNDHYVERKGLNLKQSNETLCRLIQEGDELAKEEICIKNKRLVYKYALAYSKYYNHKLDLQDLVQTGFIGLLKGAERFDCTMGTMFSTYVVWWIKQQISREIMDNGFTIRVPVHVFETVNKLGRVEEQLTHDLGRKPTVEELAEAMGMEVSKVRELMSLKDNILKISSLDVPVGEEADTPLWELIEDTFIDPTEKLCEQIVIYEILDKALRELPEREEKVIRLRFGFDDGNPHTLEQVGQIMGVTRERIRQIEAKAIRKLSQRMRNKGLYGYFD